MGAGFQTPLELWRSKQGLDEDMKNDSMRMGDVNEPFIAELFSERMQTDIMYPGPSGRDGIWRWNCDAAIPEQNAVVEFKWKSAFSRKSYGGDVPMDAFLQAQFYAGMLGAATVHVAVMFGGPPIDVYTLPFNRHVFSDIKNKCQAWWHKHMILGQEPPWESRDGETMDSRNEVPLVLTDEMLNALMELQSAREEAALGAERKDSARGKILNLLRGHKVARRGDWGVRVEDTRSPKTDFQAAFWKLVSTLSSSGHSVDVVKILAENTKICRTKRVTME